MAELELDTLESKGLIRVATIDPELEYLFRHALIQDAAYESLLKQERRSLHRLVGDALEQLYPDRHGELAAVLARHFEQAGEPEKAVEYLVEAAHFAWQRNAVVEAYDLYGRAAALIPAPSADDDAQLRHRRLEVDLGRLKSGFSFLDEPTMLAMIPALSEQADQTDELRLAADVYMHIALLQSFRPGILRSDEELERTLARTAQIARELDDPSIEAVPKSLIGISQVFSGHLRVGVETLRAAAPILRQKRAFVGSSFALVALAIGLARMGRFAEAQEAADGATSLAESGDVIARIDAMIGETVVSSIRGDLNDAVKTGSQCAELAMSAGAAACLVSSSFFLGDAQMRSGQFGDAKISFERSGSVADVTDFKIFRPSIAAHLRSTMASLGGGDVNAMTFDEALDEARMSGDLWGEANVIWKRAETEATRPDGDADQMLADFASAASSFERMEAPPFQARVLRGWGDALLAMGRAEEAEARRSEARALFEEIGLDREAADLGTANAGV